MIGLKKPFGLLLPGLHAFASAARDETTPFCAPLHPSTFATSQTASHVETSCCQRREPSPSGSIFSRSADASAAGDCKLADRLPVSCSLGYGNCDSTRSLERNAIAWSTVPSNGLQSPGRRSADGLSDETKAPVPVPGCLGSGAWINESQIGHAMTCFCLDCSLDRASGGHDEALKRMMLAMMMSTVELSGSTNVGALTTTNGVKRSERLDRSA
ncbi:unnamed protein product [Protopolystoma xenopodis]|uniref:Secreted protein n=1 Tax=Protopolystoma xenopodis TaxID=117903 RepID=A0A3S5ACK6_9PLAT|nr:unnamed protein product [Protopolystoma xenopodis]